MFVLLTKNVIDFNHNYMQNELKSKRHTNNNYYKSIKFLLCLFVVPAQIRMQPQPSQEKTLSNHSIVYFWRDDFLSAN